MEVTINYNGQAVAVEVTLEVYEFLDRADHKTENLFHEQRRHWDGREFDEYIAFTEGVGVYSETPEEYLCRMETLHELMAVLDTSSNTPCKRLGFFQTRFIIYSQQQHDGRRHNQQTGTTITDQRQRQTFRRQHPRRRPDVN